MVCIHAVHLKKALSGMNLILTIESSYVLYFTQSNHHFTKDETTASVIISLITSSLLLLPLSKLLTSFFLWLTYLAVHL